MSERWKLVLLVGVFALAFFLPIESPRMQGALLEGFWLLKDYARQHVILCLVPAFFIGGIVLLARRSREGRTFEEGRGPCPACGAEQTFRLRGRFALPKETACPACRARVVVERRVSGP